MQGSCLGPPPRRAGRVSGALTRQCFVCWVRRAQLRHLPALCCSRAAVTWGWSRGKDAAVSAFQEPQAVSPPCWTLTAGQSARRSWSRCPVSLPCSTGAGLGTAATLPGTVVLCGPSPALPGRGHCWQRSSAASRSLCAPVGVRGPTRAALGPRTAHAALVVSWHARRCFPGTAGSRLSSLLFALCLGLSQARRRQEDSF